MNKCFQMVGLLLITLNTVAMNKKNKLAPTKIAIQKTHTIEKKTDRPGFSKREKYLTQEKDNRPGFSKIKKEYLSNIPNTTTTNNVVASQVSISSHSNFNIQESNTWQMQLINAAISKKLLYVKNAIENHRINVNAAPYKGITALHIACADGSLDIVKYLITKNADVNVKDCKGYTPLMYALFEKNEDIVNYLKSKGVTE